MFRTSLFILALAIATAATARADTVPDVVGLDVEKAEGMLVEAGFTATVETSPGRPIGHVFSQEPGGFSQRNQGTNVTIKVFAPTPKPTVPDTPSTPPGPGPGPGGVDPDIGTPPGGDPGPAPDMGPGTTPPSVDPGPAPSDPGATASGFTFEGRPLPMDRMPDTRGPPVPSVLGQTGQQARGTLNSWRVEVEQTLGVANLVGRVVNQYPHAGRTLARGETVTIVVAVARPPSPQHASVPLVENQPWQSAMATLRRAGFSVQPSVVPSNDQARGRVLWQKPMPGSLHAQGSLVGIRIGRGSGRATPAPGPRDVPPTVPVQPPTGPTVPEGPGVDLSGSAPAPRTPPPGESYPHRFGADFTWTPVPGATVYEWQLDEELPSGAWQRVTSRMVTGTRFRPEKMQRGRFRWRVRAVHQSSKSQWSPYQRLYMY